MAGAIVRPDRVRKQIMEQIRPLDGLIESSPRKGYRLKPELLE